MGALTIRVVLVILVWLLIITSIAYPSKFSIEAGEESQRGNGCLNKTIIESTCSGWSLVSGFQHNLGAQAVAATIGSFLSIFIPMMWMFFTNKAGDQLPGDHKHAKYNTILISS